MRAKVIATVFAAIVIFIGRRIVVERIHICAPELGVGVAAEGKGDKGIVWLLPVNECCNADDAMEHGVRGELTDEYLQVFTGKGIRVRKQWKPAAAGLAIDDDVRAGCTVERVELSDPIVHGIGHRIDGRFTSCDTGRSRHADGHNTVVFDVGKCSKQKAVVCLVGHVPKNVLVEVVTTADTGRIIGIAINSSQKVLLVGEFDVDTIGVVPC